MHRAKGPRTKEVRCSLQNYRPLVLNWLHDPFWPLEFGGGSWIFAKFYDWRKQRRVMCGRVEKNWR